jgi:hypothetical protein
MRKIWQGRKKGLPAQELEMERFVGKNPCPLKENPYAAL